MAGMSLVVYAASYDGADEAQDDFAGVRRLQRDGIITLLDAAVVVRSGAAALR